MQSNYYLDENVNANADDEYYSEIHKQHIKNVLINSLFFAFGLFFGRMIKTS